LPEFCKKALSPITVASFTAATIVGAAMTAVGLAAAAVLYFGGNGWRILVFDSWDMSGYFASARWVIEGGRLYREVFSPYPLFANIIFAILRYLSNLLHPGVHGFYGLWIASTWVVYLYAVYRIATETTRLAALAWLAPAPIYFAVFRFDIYPAVATLMALFAIRRTSYIEGAIWLGVAAALKGYALWMLPAYCVYMLYQRGFASAIKVGALGVAPMILSLLITLIFAGWEGVIAPFKADALWTLSGESSYDAINYFFSVPAISNGPEVRWVAQSLQVGCALTAAALRPRSFDDLVNTFLFAVLGFMSFSVFYSPQYVLWILPLVSFSRSPVMLISAIFLSWLTYLYGPFSFFLSWLTYYYYPIRSFSQLAALNRSGAIIAVSLLRLFMMLLAIREHFARRQRPQLGQVSSARATDPLR
jgi:hypothetical protein